MKRLDNLTALITGGNSGIGYATAKAFAEEGAQVIITGRNPVAIQKAAAELGVTGLVADQADLLTINQLAEDVKAAAGTIDIIFLNAGIATFAPFEQVTEEHFDNLMNTNFKGVFFTLQALLPLLNEGGSIIFNTSINANIGMPGSGVYGASKGALLSLNRILATELAPKKIRVNAISPGPVETPVYNKLGMTSEEVGAFGETLSKKILFNRFGQSEEIAKLAIFLGSAESAFITGTEIVIDGGISVNPVLN